MRFIILLLILYLGYWLFKTWVKKKLASTVFNNKNQHIVDDVMVKDPYCGVYFAKRDGVLLESGGKRLFFCCEACKAKYIESKT